MDAPIRRFLASRTNTPPDVSQQMLTLHLKQKEKTEDQIKEIRNIFNKVRQEMMQSKQTFTEEQVLRRLLEEQKISSLQQQTKKFLQELIYIDLLLEKYSKTQQDAQKQTVLSGIEKIIRRLLAKSKIAITKENENEIEKMIRWLLAKSKVDTPTKQTIVGQLYRRIAAKSLDMPTQQQQQQTTPLLKGYEPSSSPQKKKQTKKQGVFAKLIRRIAAKGVGKEAQQQTQQQKQIIQSAEKDEDAVKKAERATKATKVEEQVQAGRLVDLFKTQQQKQQQKQAAATAKQQICKKLGQKAQQKLVGKQPTKLQQNQNQQEGFRYF